jgi:arylsulfatase A
MAPSSISAAADDDRPNFLIILCDDLGYGDLACYGHPVIRTPNLDRLAAQGVRLTDCYSAAPVCSPSRAGLLTGRTPNRTGVYDWIPDNHIMHLPRSEITIASILQRAGYATCHVGKWHCNGAFNTPEQPQPDDHGFAYWFSTQNNASPSHSNPRNFVRNGEPAGPLQGYSCSIVADEAIGWLSRQRNQGSPFFLFVCFHEPHEPLASPPELEATYPTATKKGQATYYANVTNMDAAVGKLMAALDELDLAEDTFVFFTSDNGPETLNRYRGAWRSHGSPGPLRGMKLHVYDGGIRVPGIIRWPGHTDPGAVVDEPVSGVDVLPTLCSIAGVEIPADRAIDGSDIMPMLRGQSIERRTPLFWSYYRALSAPRAAMRLGNWKIVARWDGPARPNSANVSEEAMSLIKSAQLTDFELYDLRRDIAEQADLRDQHPDTFKRMTARLVQLYRSVQREGRSWY